MMATPEPRSANRDDSVVADFGDEWSRFDQARLPPQERDAVAASYFAHLDWSRLPAAAHAVDVGCGSGRWADVVAPRVGRLTCLDASEQAARVARRTLAGHANTAVLVSSVDEMPLHPGSADLVYSLGVLHHVPDTAAAIGSCARLLRPGGILYVYLYYSMENRPPWFRALWRVSDVVRGIISRSPRAVKNALCEVIAVAVYWPLARIALVAERAGVTVDKFPLAPYRRLGLYTLRTDARDRFGTRLEQRFTRAQVVGMLEGAGLVDVVVPDAFPYWIGVGHRPAE